MSFAPTGTVELSPPVTTRPGPGRIDWSRFLERPPYSLSRTELEKHVSGKAVLITGAGGSIGSSLALLLIKGLPKTLLLLDRSEQNLLALRQRLAEKHLVFSKIEFLQGDILDEQFLEDVFLRHGPDVVFHTAALKHLPSLESEPFAALENNVRGTFNVLKMVDCFRVRLLINISTDKAVNPTSVLGASKRLAELLLLAGHRTDPPRVSFRMGNVLGSSGSVGSIFPQRLRDGLPINISDPGASRYFLTLEEAAAFLVSALDLQESSLLLPEMGAPRTIMDLAIFMLHELQVDPHTQPINITGLLDGEKRSEQLTFSYERVEKLETAPIWKIGGLGTFLPDRFPEDLGELLNLVHERRKTGLLEALQRLMPEFTPSSTLLRSIS